MADSSPKLATLTKACIRSGCSGLRSVANATMARLSLVGCPLGRNTGVRLPSEKSGTAANPPSLRMYSVAGSDSLTA